MMLYEEGRLLLTDPVSKYIPERQSPGRREKLDPATGKTVFYTMPAAAEMTIQDLLRHTSGFTYGNRGTTQFHKLYRSRRMTGLTASSRRGVHRAARPSCPLLNQPGTTWEYGLRPTSRAGRRGRVGQAARRGSRRAHLPPLKMTDTGFVVSAPAGPPRSGPGDRSRHDKEIKLLDPTMPPKFECGGGCGVSTARDYVRFTQMLLNRGTLDGARFSAAKRSST